MDSAWHSTNKRAVAADIDNDDEFWGLLTPPLDDEADQNFSVNLSKIFEDDNGGGGGVGVRNHNHNKKKQHHGKVKQLRVLTAASSTTKPEETLDKEEEIIGSNIQAEKKDISTLDEAGINLKLERSKRKLSEGYKQAEAAKKQRRIQVIDIKNLPKQGSCLKPPVKKLHVLGGSLLE